MSWWQESPWFTWSKWNLELTITLPMVTSEMFDQVLIHQKIKKIYLLKMMIRHSRDDLLPTLEKHYHFTKMELRGNKIIDQIADRGSLSWMKWWILRVEPEWHELEMPLMILSQKGHLETIKYLLNENPSRLISKELFTNACLHGQLETAQWLHQRWPWSREELLNSSLLYHLVRKQQERIFFWLQEKYHIQHEEMINDGIYYLIPGSAMMNWMMESLIEVNS